MLLRHPRFFSLRPQALLTQNLLPLRFKPLPAKICVDATLL